MASEMAALIAQGAQREGMVTTDVPNLNLFRYSTAEASGQGMFGPSVCVVAQGAKRVVLGPRSILQSNEQLVFTPVDLPVSGNVVEATKKAPFLGFRYDFDVASIRALVLELSQSRHGQADQEQGLLVVALKPELTDAFVRLLRLMGRPQDAGLLSPLIRKEIMYLLYRDGFSELFERIARTSSHLHRVAEVINWMKTQANTSITSEQLEKRTGMSSSLLHQQFKHITGMSPLHFHKQVRLQNARKFLFTEDANAALAATRAGYKSVPQFNRDYKKLFGVSPIRDVRRSRG